MPAHLGGVEIKVFEPVPKTQTAGEGARIPPHRKAPAGYDWGDGVPPVFRRPSLRFGNNPEGLSEEDLDCILMLALGDPRMELPGFDNFLKRYADVITPQTELPTEEQTTAFLAACRNQGLIKPQRPLTLREYFGALTPSEPVDIQIGRWASNLCNRIFGN